MLDTLNLEALQTRIDMRKEQLTQLEQERRVVTFTILGAGILAPLLLNMSFWILNPTGLMVIAVMAWLCHFLSYRLRLEKLMYGRTQNMLERFLPPDRLSNNVHLPTRVAVEMFVFLIAIYIGAAFLNGYRQEGFPLTFESILRDLDIAPQWAIPFILSWATVTVMILWWVFNLWRSRQQILAMHRTALTTNTFRLAVIIVMIFDFVSNFNQEETSSLMLILFPFLFLHILSWIIQALVIRRFVQPYYSKGDYIGALRRLEQFLRFRPPAQILRYFKAIILNLKGEPNASEQVTLAWLEDYQYLSGQSIRTAFLLLSAVNEQQQKYDNALDYSQGTITLYPENPDGYIQLASVYIEQEANLDRALELTQFAHTLEKKPLPLQTIIHAVALAHNGDFQSANQVIDEIEQAGIPANADIAAQKSAYYYYRGLIAQLQEDIDGARRHLEQAVAVDPNGANGDQARQLLATL